MPSKRKRSKETPLPSAPAPPEGHVSTPERHMSASSEATTALAAPAPETETSRKRKGKRKRSNNGARGEDTKLPKRKRTGEEAGGIAGSCDADKPSVDDQQGREHQSLDPCPPVPLPSAPSPDRTAALEARIAELEAQVGAYAEVAACETNLIGGIQEDLTCGICCAPLWRPHAAVPCGHVFCLGCLIAWFQQRREASTSLMDSHKHCPRCRTQLTHAPVELWIPKSINERLDSGGVRLRQLHAVHTAQLDRLPELGDGIGTHTTPTEGSEAPRVLTEAERDAQAGLTDRLRSAQTLCNGKPVGPFYDIFLSDDGLSKLGWDFEDKVWRCLRCHSEVAYWECQGCEHRFTQDDIPAQYPREAYYDLQEWGHSTEDPLPPMEGPPETDATAAYRIQLAQADWRLVNVLGRWKEQLRLDRPEVMPYLLEMVQLRTHAYQSRDDPQEGLRRLLLKLDAMESIYGQFPVRSGVYPAPFSGPTSLEHAPRPPPRAFDSPLSESVPSSPEQASDADSNGNLAGFIDGDGGASPDGSFSRRDGTSDGDPFDDDMSASARGETPRSEVVESSDGEVVTSSDDDGSPSHDHLATSPSSDHVGHSQHPRTSALLASRQGGRAGRSRGHVRIIDSDDE